MEENKPKTFQEFVEKTLDMVRNRAEREVPEYGDFSPVIEYFENPHEPTKSVVGKYGVKIYKMPKDVVPDPKKRYIQALAYVPSGDYKAHVNIMSGTKEEILKSLNNPEFRAKFNETCGELLEMLKR